MHGLAAQLCAKREDHESQQVALASLRWLTFVQKKCLEQALGCNDAAFIELHNDFMALLIRS